MTTTDRSLAADAQPAASPAELYERFAVPALFAPAADRLLAAARPRVGDRVLDVGTGTGIVARRVAPLVAPTGAVVGLDANAAMLGIARVVAAREGLDITWRQGMAESLPFPDASFDLVLAQYSLMFFADVPAALAEMRRVLTPAGRMACSVFQEIARHPLYQALDRAVARHLGTPAIATIFAAGNRDALGAALAQAGFRNVTITPHAKTMRLGPPAGFLEGEIALDVASVPAMQGLDAAATQALIEAITPEMTDPLRAATIDGEVDLVFHDYVVRADR